MQRKAAWKPEINGAWVSCSRIGFGQAMYVLYVPNHNFPIGFVWGESVGKRFCVAGSYVEPWARRHGVRTLINKEIFRTHIAISTVYGSEEGGIQFMKASKYKHSRLLDCFYLLRPKKKRG